MPRYLKRRHQTWYFNMAIPRHLRQHFDGKSMIVQSLKTRDLRVAQPLALKLAAEWQTRFRTLEGDDDEAERLARIEYEKTKEEALEGKYQLFWGLKGMDPDPEFGLLDPVREGIDFTIQQIVEDEAPKRGLVPLAGDPLPPDLQARVDALNDARRILDDEEPVNRTKYEPPFRELAERWLEQWKRRPGRKATNTAAQYASTIRLFSEWWGSKPIRKVKKRDAARFVEEVLKCLPPNYGRSEADKRRPLKDILASAPEDTPGLSAASINRHVGVLKTIWRWAKQLEYCEGDNPFDGLREKLTKHNQKSYLPWEIDELQRLLNPPPKRRDLYELILVGMFTAMRINEIANLTWGDLRQGEGGIWYFRIDDAKTDAGHRIIPVHSRLSWITKRERGPDEERIWPRFNPEGPSKKPGADASRMFSAFKVQRGFTDRRKTFHSFRKNVTAMMENAGLPPNQWARIIGHEPGFTYGTYNPHGLTLARMKEIIEVIRYDGLTYEEPEP